MKIMKIMGGLGNQMFQYAYARNLELKGKKVIFDISFFYGNKAEGDTPRDFKLNNFNLLTKAQFSKKPHRILDFLVKVKRKIGFNIFTDYPSEKYFIDNREEIKKEFVLKQELGKKSLEILEKIKSQNSVSVHIRRGDYISNEKISQHHGVCELDYYLAAIKVIKDKIINPVFFIFTDDINWVKENFSGNEYFLVSGLSISDVEELVLMSKCKNHIISNSSFSWWGAWLGVNPKKIVVAPSLWLKAKPKISEKIIPDSWIKI